MSCLRRFLTSRGFGVHSPFAFSLITETLRQPYGYYSYKAIDSFATPSGRALARLVYRIALRFASTGLRVVGNLSPTLSMAIGAAGAKVNENSVVTLVLDMSRWRGEVDSLGDRGMTFDCGIVGLVVADPGLPRQDFKLYA